MRLIRTNPTLVDQIDVTPYGNAANSVASGGVVAAAVEADPAGSRQARLR